MFLNRPYAKAVVMATPCFGDFTTTGGQTIDVSISVDNELIR